jgi:hypothetical protein
MSLEGNHVTMCRFQSVKSPGYIAVVSALDRITISKSATISSQLLDIPVIPSSKMEEDIQDIFKLSKLWANPVLLVVTKNWQNSAMPKCRLRRMRQLPEFLAQLWRVLRLLVG